MDNFLQDIGIGEIGKPMDFSKPAPYIEDMENVTQPAVSDEQPEYAKWGLNNQEEMDLMEYVKTTGGTADDFTYVLEDFRGKQQDIIKELPEEQFKFEEYLPTAPTFDITVEPTEGVLESNKQLAQNMLATAGNVLPSMWNAVAGLANLAINTAKDPVETSKALFNGISNLTEKKAIELEKEFEKGGEVAVINNLLETGIKFVGKNPADIIGFKNPKLLLEATKETAKLGGKLAGKTVSGAAEVGIQALGKTTGAGAEAIRTAFKQGGKESFGNALRGGITDEAILNAAKKGLETIKSQRKELYGKDYTKLAKNTKELDIGDIQVGLADELSGSGIKIGDDGILDFSKSTITQGTSQKQIQSIADDVFSWADTKATGLDVLKQRVQDRFMGSVESAKADRFSSIIGNQIKDKIVKEVPEYAKMSATYSKITDELKDITKTLSLGDKAQKSTAITRLNQTLKDNLAFRKEALELLEESSGIDLKSALAGAALKDIMPKGLQGVVSGGVLGYGAAGSIFTPAVVAGILSASPRVIGEFAKAIGTTADTVKKGLKGMKEVLGKGFGNKGKLKDGKFDIPESEFTVRSDLPDDFNKVGTTKSAKITKGDDGLTLYHGTNKEFDKFLNKKFGSGAGSFYGEGVYLTSNKEIAKNYAETLSVKGGIKNLITTNVKGKVLDIDKPLTKELSDNLLDSLKPIIKDDIYNNLIGKHLFKTPKEMFNILSSKLKKQVSLEEGLAGKKQTIINNELKKKGYEGLKFSSDNIDTTKGLGGDNFVIFDASNAKILKNSLFNLIGPTVGGGLIYELLKNK